MDQPLNPTEYPRSYRTSGLWLCVNVLLSLIFSIPGLGLCWLDLSEGTGSSRDIALLAVGCVLTLLAALPIVTAFKSKVVLDADRIETQGLFSTRSLQRSEILGRRVGKNNDGVRTGGTWLIPRGADHGEDAENSITISNELNTDPTLREWIDSLPDLDAPERLASEAEILEGTNSPAERKSRLLELAHVKILCRCLTVLAAVACFWGMFFPNRPVILFLVLLPWLAVGITRFSGGLAHLLSFGNNDAHAYLGIPAILPGILLMFAAVQGQLQWKPMLGMTPEQGLTSATWIWIGLGVLCGLCLLAVSIASDPTFHKNAAITVLLLPFFLEYGLVAVVAVDILLDRSAPTVYSSKIVKTFQVSGRHTTDWVTLAPWGATLENKGDVCDSSLYYSVRVGDPVYVELSPGMLHIPWFVLKRSR
jgi:hypothetical protein